MCLGVGLCLVMCDWVYDCFCLGVGFYWSCYRFFFCLGVGLCLFGCKIVSGCMEVFVWVHDGFCV